MRRSGIGIALHSGGIGFERNTPLTFLFPFYKSQVELLIIQEFAANFVNYHQCLLLSKNHEDFPLQRHNMSPYLWPVSHWTQSMIMNQLVRYESPGGTSDSWVPTSDFRLLISDFWVPTSDFRLLTSEFRLLSSDFWVPTSDFRLPTSDFRLPTSKFKWSISDVRLISLEIRPDFNTCIVMFR